MGRIRVAAIVGLVLALAASVSAFAGRAQLAAVASVVAGALFVWIYSLARNTGAARAAESAAAQKPETERSRQPSDVTVLVAAVRDAAGAGRFADDLRRILEGIVRDERGKVGASNGSITAVFRGRRDHAHAAVHAAQRMLSNVDALSRRLDRDVRISIGVDTADEEAATGRAIELQKLADENRTAVLVSAATVGQLPSERTILAAIDADARLFSFTPVQQRLF